MALAHLMMINIELLNNDLDVVPEQAPLIILDIKSDICMAMNGKDNKHTRYISIRKHCVRNVEEFNLHKTVWCEGVLKLAYIGTNNVRYEELNPRLEYAMARLKN